ncbi:hypothetical protein BR10RB9215_C12186 [Brucella sp. 10RB9215]|nr:hypothetical protein BR10RB9215_C12186 [Brucella sp. 10RB9215]
MSPKGETRFRVKTCVKQTDEYCPQKCETVLRGVMQQKQKIGTFCHRMEKPGIVERISTEGRPDHRAHRFSNVKVAVTSTMERHKFARLPVYSGNRVILAVFAAKKADLAGFQPRATFSALQHLQKIVGVFEADRNAQQAVRNAEFCLRLVGEVLVRRGRRMVIRLLVSPDCW